VPHIRIDEGRLIESRCPDCGNLERRAFGESESRRGELASYAIGWTSGHGLPIAHMTIGIGAGNEGGGTFHIEIRPQDDAWAMGLVDEPFEDVPEGGPDLSRAEALAHGDIEYVWLVADHVMAQDRRALWMQHWLLSTSALATEAVIAGAAPVRRAIHETEEWVLLDALDASDGDLHAFQLFRAIDWDPSLLDVIDLAEGESAQRTHVGDRWIRRKG
jgi:hypothetical protein